RFPNLSRRSKQGACVSDGSPTHRTAMEDSRVPEKPHVEEAAEAEAGTPEITMDRPTGARQVVRRPAPAHFHDRNTIALLHKSMSGNTAAEARTDDNKIEVELVVESCHGFTTSSTSAPGRTSPSVL